MVCHAWTNQSFTAWIPRFRSIFSFTSLRTQAHFAKAAPSGDGECKGGMTNDVEPMSACLGTDWNHVAGDSGRCRSRRFGTRSKQPTNQPSGHGYAVQYMLRHSYILKVIGQT